MLGGCSQEPKEPTELERCIEANTLKDNLKEVQASYDEISKEEMEAVDYYELVEIIRGKTNRLGKEITECRGKKFPSHALLDMEWGSKEWEAMGKEELYYLGLSEEEQVLYWEKIAEDCRAEVNAKEVERAKNHCHSQGIY